MNASFADPLRIRSAAEIPLFVRMHVEACRFIRKAKSGRSFGAELKGTGGSGTKQERVSKTDDLFTAAMAMTRCAGRRATLEASAPATARLTASLESPDEGGPAFPIRTVNIGPGFQEQLDHVTMAKDGCQDDGRGTTFVCAIDVDEWPRSMA